MKCCVVWTTPPRENYRNQWDWLYWRTSRSYVQDQGIGGGKKKTRKIRYASASEDTSNTEIIVVSMDINYTVI
jgi:hypothetical protein